MSNSFTFEVIFCNLFTVKKKSLKVERNILSQVVVLFFLVCISEEGNFLNKMSMAKKEAVLLPTPTLFYREQQKSVHRSSYFKAGQEKHYKL